MIIFRKRKDDVLIFDREWRYISWWK